MTKIQSNQSTNLLSISIITKNEEHNIERCLKSAKWADEIVVVDSGSTDRTLSICKSYQCKIIETEWLGFGETKQLAVDQASNNWVFSIDADEEITPELQRSIEHIMNAPSADGFHIKRTSYYLQKKIQYSGWQSDYPLRLFNKTKGRFNDASVHETITMNNECTTAVIDAPLLHYPYPSIASHINKINLYTSLGADNLHQQHRRASLLYAFASGGIKFIKMYLFKRGFLDGKEGLVLALLSSFSSTLKYFKLWSLWRTR